MRWLSAEGGPHLAGKLTRLFPSSTAIITVTAYLLSLTWPVTNPDVFLQLALGAAIVQQGQIPETNQFSFAAGEQAWRDPAWLSQVLFHQIDTLYGSQWLILIRGVCYATTLALLYRLLRRKGGVLPSMALAGAALVLTLPGLAVGPSLFSLLLFTLLLTLLEDRDWRLGPSLFLLPPLFLLWVNLDGLFVLGLVVLTLHILGGFLDWRRDEGTSAWFYHLMGLLPALLFSLWNPYYSSIYVRGVEESWGLLTSLPSWLPGALPGAWPVGLLMIPALVSFWLARGALRRRLLFPLVFMGLWGVLRPGAWPLLCILAVVALMENVQVLAERVRHGPDPGGAGVLTALRRRLIDLGDRLKVISFFDRRLTGHVYIYLTAVMSLVLFSIKPGQEVDVLGTRLRGLSLVDLVTPDLAPQAATRYLKEAAFPQARVLAPAGAVGYLIYESQAGFQVLYDGRPEAHPPMVLEDFQRFVDMEPGWEAILEHYQIDYLLWGASAFQPRALVTGGNWQLLHADAFSVVLGRAGAEGQAAESETTPPWWSVQISPLPRPERTGLTPGPEHQPGGMFGPNRTVTGAP